MIRGKWMNGRVVPEEAVDWPEGTVVYLSREPWPNDDASRLARQDDHPDDVAAWLRWYDSLEPLVYAPGEEAEIDAARRAVSDYSRRMMDQGTEGVFE